mmetsp:Transcript_33575/g.73269  ORF Transcript_33575/g.73269 Transcript_33575/m.73269 type:complete len:581 (+) Transcript_33575:892-2634(+)
MGEGGGRHPLGGGGGGLGGEVPLGLGLLLRELELVELVLRLLQRPHGGVDPVLPQQLHVRALLRHLAVAHDDDAVAVFDSGEAVRHSDARAALGQALQRRLDALLRLGVEGGGGLVAHHEARLAHEGACDGHALLLAAAQLQPALPDHRRVLLGELRAHRFVELRGLGGVHDLLLGDPGAPEGDVVEERVVEERRVLRHDGGGGADGGEGEVAGVLLVQEHRAGRRIVHPQQHLQQRGLAGAGGPDDGDVLAAADVEGHAAQHLAVGVVPEPHILELHLHPPLLLGQLEGPVLHFGHDVEHVEHRLHVHQRLPQLAVEESEEAQRRPQLHQQSVHQDEVARGDGGPGEGGGGGEGGGDADGHGDGLPGVQGARRFLRAHRCVLVVAQQVVVQRAPHAAVVEVLDGLHVDQRVHRRARRQVVQPVHLLAQLRGLAGPDDGPRDVDGEGGHDDEHQDGGEGGGEEVAHQQQLHHRRQEGEHHRPEHHRHRPGAALDDAGEGPRAARHVELDVEIYDVREDGERHLAARLLRHRRERHAPQLVRRARDRLTHAGEDDGFDGDVDAPRPRGERVHRLLEQHRYH